MTHKEALAAIIAAWDEPHYGDMEAARDSLFEPIEAARKLIKNEPIGYKDPVPVSISNRDAYTIRMALILAAHMVEGNAFIREALEVAEALLIATEKERDKAA